MSQDDEADRVGEYVIEPLGPGDIAVHLSGVLLNLSVLVPALWWLATRGIPRSAFAACLLGAWAGTYLADFVTGLLHWGFDTWFSETMPSIRRMVLLVREHHIHPQRIFKYGFWHDAGILSWFAFAVCLPLAAPALLAGGAAGPVRYGCLVAGVVASLEIVFMLELHKCGHRVRRPAFVRALQRAHLLLSPEHHLSHHSGRHDRNYCLVTGVFDRTAGRLGAWRALEAAISRVTGAVPRENDRWWRQRYGPSPD